LEPFAKIYSPLPCFYVWGHAYEFPKDDNWGMIEEFCREVSTIEDAWFATNIEIYDYVTALDRLEFSVDGKAVHNPSAVSVWVSDDSEAVEIVGGGTYMSEK
nr:polysaccharide deacetylase [Clostridia bacterium]